MKKINVISEAAKPESKLTASFVINAKPDAKMTFSLGSHLFSVYVPVSTPRYFACKKPPK